MGGGVGALGSGVSLVSAIGTAAAMAAGVGLVANMARAGMAGGTAGSQALMQAVSNGSGSAPPPTNMITGPGGGPSGSGPSGSPTSTPPKGSPSGSMPLAAAMDGVGPGPQFAGRSYPSVTKSNSDTSTSSPEPTFGGESLSKGKTDNTAFDPKEEIAAFRDRKEPFNASKGGKA